MLNNPGSGATKHLFIVPTFGIDRSQITYHPSYLINATSDNAQYVFSLPHDFKVLIALYSWHYPLATATMRCNFRCAYGALGESASEHQISLTDIDMAMTQNQLQKEDISAVLAAAVIGDCIGLEVIGDSVSTPNLHALMLELRYA